MWDIVSFGDVKTLNMVFNAIAAIFSDGGYKAAGYALAIMVVVGMSLSSLATGKQELPFPRMLAAFIVFSFGFMTLTKVSIENRYDGTVTQIDNIPVAVAVPASLISQIGLYLVEAGETAFGDTGANRVSANGYLSPLSIIASYRTASMIDNCPAGEANSTGGGINLCYTLRQYYSECTSIKATRQNAYLAIREGNALQSMQYSSNAYTTKVVKSDGSSEIMNCSTAYDLIANAMNGSTFEQMIAANNIPAGVRLGEDGFTRTTDALEAIGLDGGKNRSFLQALYLRKAAEDGTLAFLHRTGAADMAENLQSSIEQRNYAWTMQGELWTQIVDKFIAIIECLIYALAPFIGLMVLVGTIGSKTVMLYLQMLAIIQLIPVMLVITQNIIMADMESYATMLGAKYDVGSLVFTEQLTDKAKELMGLGGMLASTVVPALAMALVTGSGMAVMGAFRQVGAPAKDVDASPDMTGQGGAVTNLGQMNTGNRDEYGNVMTDRAKANVGSISQSSAFTSSVQSSEQQMQAASQAYSTALSNAQSTVNEQSYTSSSVQSMGNNITTGLESANGWSSSVQQQLTQSMGLNEQQANNVKNAVSAGLTVASMGGSWQEVGSTLKSKEEKEAFEKMVSGEEGKSTRSTFNDAINILSQNGESITTGNKDIDSAIKNIQESSQEVQSSQSAYQQMKSLQDTLQVSNDDMPTQMYQYAQQESVQSSIDDRISSMTDNELLHYNNTLDRYDGGIDANAMDNNTARLMALAATDNAFGNQSQFIETITGGSIQSNTGESTLAPENNTTVPSSLKYGSLERESINEPTNTDKTFKNDLDDYKTAATEQQLSNNRSVSIAQYEDSNTSEIDTGKNKLDQSEVVLNENTKEAIENQVTMTESSINSLISEIDKIEDSVRGFFGGNNEPVKPDKSTEEIPK